MIIVSTVLAAARRFAPGLPVLGLALAAGLAGGTAPALAAPGGWQNSCQFKTIPGSGGEGLRYDECLRLETCQRMANAAGQTIFQAGCFGFAPDEASRATGTRSAR